MYRKLLQTSAKISALVLIAGVLFSEGVEADKKSYKAPTIDELYNSLKKEGLASTTKEYDGKQWTRYTWKGLFTESQHGLQWIIQAQGSLPVPAGSSGHLPPQTDLFGSLVCETSRPPSPLICRTKRQRDEHPYFFLSAQANPDHIESKWTYDEATRTFNEQ